MFSNLLSPVSIAAYGFACVVFFPGPSELPVAGYTKVPLWIILASLAVGRVIAVLGLSAFERATRLNKLLTSILGRTHPRWSRALAFVREKGVLGMAVIVAVPGFPFRSPLYVILLSRPNLLLVTPVYICAAAARDLIVWAGIVGVRAAISKWF